MVDLKANNLPSITLHQLADPYDDNTGAKCKPPAIKRAEVAIEYVVRLIAKPNYKTFGFCVFTTCIAVAMRPLISPRLAGTIIELFVLASCAKAPTYCSATFKLTASSPPGSRMAAPT